MPAKSIITILSREVIDDLRSAGWLISEISDLANIHTCHQIADICEKDNIDAVWRVLGIAVAEVRVELVKILEPQKGMTFVNRLKAPESWEFGLCVRMTDSAESYLREKIHEYLVARVMADRTSAIIPASAAYWQTRASEAIEGIRLSAATSAPGARHARRPLWPM